MIPFPIETREQYDCCLARGIEPLIDRRFAVDLRLRVSIQRELFGAGHTPEENERFYRWCWAHKPHRCEECMKPLPEYSAVYVSHIKSRGAEPEMAHDPRNTNILCFRHHSQWENGNRESMRIYLRNQSQIEKLNYEYRNTER